MCHKLSLNIRNVFNSEFESFKHEQAHLRVTQEQSAYSETTLLYHIKKQMRAVTKMPSGLYMFILRCCI